MWGFVIYVKIFNWKNHRKKSLFKICFTKGQINVISLFLKTKKKKVDIHRIIERFRLEGILQII